MKNQKYHHEESQNPYILREGSTITVIGMGMVGASWAALFACHGWKVNVFDNNPDTLDTGIENVNRYAKFLVENKLAQEEKTRIGLGALSTHIELGTAVAGATLVQEAIIEDLEIKTNVFKDLDRYTSPDTLLITSSSGLSISQIQSGAQHPERCLAGHPYNPPHLIPLVEIAPGNKTSPKAIEAAHKFYVSLGKKPIVLKREIPGYLANRMSAALWREAINLVMEDVASVEDIDNAIRYGPGLRWSVVGPHLTYHLGGGLGGIRYHTEHLLHSKEMMWQSLDDWKTFPLEALDLLEEGLPASEEFNSLMAERDLKLARMIKVLDRFT